MPSHVMTFKDGLHASIDFRITQYGSDTTYSPLNGASGGDGPEIEIENALTFGGDPVNLTEAQMQEAEEHILTHFDFADYGGWDDYYG